MIVKITGLVGDLSKSFLYDLFRHFGRIERLSFNKQTGIAKILFENLSSAILALQLNEKEINGNKITVDFDCNLLCLPTKNTLHSLTEYLKSKQKTFLMVVENFAKEPSNENIVNCFGKKVAFMKVFIAQPNYLFVFVEFDSYLNENELKDVAINLRSTDCLYAPSSGLKYDELLPVKEFLSSSSQELHPDQERREKFHSIPSTTGVRHQQHPDNKKYSEEVTVSHLYMRK